VTIKASDVKKLREKNIDSRPVFPPISQYPIWGSIQSFKPNAMKVGSNSLNLPSGVCLSKSEVDYISESIASIIGNA